MASILKIPSKHSKGIVTFTSRENQEFISKDDLIYSRVIDLKDKWIIGIHHNYHDFDFKSDHLYDFNMAGEFDLVSLSGEEFCHIPIECTHFTQDFFDFNNDNKMWDILYVGRAVKFKKIPEFFNVIRALYDQGNMFRVLFICPIPTHVDSTVFDDIRDKYNDMFSGSERQLFNLLTLDYEYPFPFDIETLSHFYKSSRILVYTADDERRPRTVAYAIASGMPTVLMASVASLLPGDKRIKPLVYLADSYEQYPSLIVEALAFTRSDEYTKNSMIAGITEFNAESNLERLGDKLFELFQVDLHEDNRMNSILYNLDIRLARHHGFGDNSNSIGWNLKSLLNYLENRSLDEMSNDVTETQDFEREISQLSQYGEKEHIYLKGQSFKGKFIALILPIYHRSKWLRAIYRTFR